MIMVSETVDSRIDHDDHTFTLRLRNSFAANRSRFDY
jgi:hypothetical protein